MSAGIGSGAARVESIAAVMGPLVGSVVLRARVGAREAGAVSLAGEIEAVEGLDVGRPSYVGSGAEDESRASAAAASVVRKFREKAYQALQAGEDDRRAILLAVALLASQLELIAATETATAFNTERSEELEEVGRRQRQRQPERRVTVALVLVEFWNAVLDRRTCRTCVEWDGEWRVVGVGTWPDGDPGEVHPRCRCMGSLAVMPVPITWESGDEDEDVDDDAA